MKTTKITQYTKSEIVEIQYGEDGVWNCTNYVYELECKKLSTELMRIMKAKQEVEVITKEYR